MTYAAFAFASRHSTHQPPVLSSFPLSTFHLPRVHLLPAIAAKTWRRHMHLHPRISIEHDRPALPSLSKVHTRLHKTSNTSEHCLTIRDYIYLSASHLISRLSASSILAKHTITNPPKTLGITAPHTNSLPHPNPVPNRAHTPHLIAKDPPRYHRRRRNNVGILRARTSKQLPSRRTSRQSLRLTGCHNRHLRQCPRPGCYRFFC